MDEISFATKAIHEGFQPDVKTGAVMPPIYMTSTFAQTSPGVHSGYEYTRANNPNFVMEETTLASLEKGKFATVFSSGLGGLTAMILGLLKSGDRVLLLNSVYGGTYRLLTRVFNRFGIEFSSHHFTSLESLNKELEKKPAWLLMESPTNPLLEILDLELILKAAKSYAITAIVDNTFATPCFQNPLEYGADIVLHSTTKYIGGHSDVIGGAVVTNDPEIKQKLDFARMAAGVNPSPFDCWLTLRGVKTLALRMERHHQNALAIAEFFDRHPLVKKTYYPGLSTHPAHDIAKKQMSGFGGIVSVEFDLSLEETNQLISSFKLFTLAESLGGVESLVNHPALMTHASIPAEERKKMGIGDGLVRFSVGIENLDDLVTDIQQTINNLTAIKY